MNPSSVYKSYFEKYTALVPEKNVLSALEKQDTVIKNFLKNVNEEKANFAYAEGKWTLKELLQHLIDTERIFTYRALAIARKETVNLPGFDENLYAKNSDANRRTWAKLGEEMKIVRQSTKMLFNSFTDEMMQYPGTFSNNPGNAETLGMIIAGHFYHHKNIVEERYL
jgi:uncharacterized damage-inducible protein DinB